MLAAIKSPLNCMDKKALFLSLFLLSRLVFKKSVLAGLCVIQITIKRSISIVLFTYKQATKERKVNNMNKKMTFWAGFLGLAISSNAMAQTELEKLRSEVNELNNKAKQWEANKTTRTRIKKDVDVLNQQAIEWEGWKAPKTLIHLAGFTDVGYTKKQGKPGSFGLGSFSPIFHFQFADRFMLEAELEFEVDEEGKSDAGIDYLTIDWFVNDYVAIVAGKFLSPLGQFRQNVHPSWINKLASAPIGFMHDQAAPNADVGVMVRGGYLFESKNSLNYSVYIANGPTLEASGTEVEKIETPGLAVDGDGKKVIGGRFGMFYPNSKFEYGVSLAKGQASVRSGVAGSFSYDASRDYDVIGTDFTWRPDGFHFKGEYVQQKIGAQVLSSAPESAKWQAWYLQAAYQFSGTKWEAVLRLGEYDTPDNATDVEQKTVGINYLFETNIVGKVSYEFNDNPNAVLTAANRLLVQLSYGF